MYARVLGRLGGGAVMFAVIRGSGSVLGPLFMCQSFSASIRFPRSARSRKMPLQDEHWLIVTPPSVRVFIAESHLGQLISSIPSKILRALVIPAEELALAPQPSEDQIG